MIWFVYFYLFFLVYLLLLMVMDYLSFLADMYLLLVSHPILRDCQIQYLLITHPAIYFILIIPIHSYTYIHYGLQNNDGWYDKLVVTCLLFLFWFVLFYFLRPLRPIHTPTFAVFHWSWFYHVIISIISAILLLFYGYILSLLLWSSLS